MTIVFIPALLFFGAQYVTCAPLNAIKRETLPSKSSTTVSDHTIYTKNVLLRDTLPECNVLQSSPYGMRTGLNTNRNNDLNDVQLAAKILDLFSGKRTSSGKDIFTGKRTINRGTDVNTNSKYVFRNARRDVNGDKYIGRRCHMAYKTCLNCEPDATGVNNCQALSIPDHWICEAPAIREAP